MNDVASTDVTHMSSFRLPYTLVEKLHEAHKLSELPKTVIVKRAIESHLRAEFPQLFEDGATSEDDARQSIH